MKRRFCIFLSVVLIEAIFAQPTTYVVQKGETIYAIAKRYNVTVAEICKVNGISDPTSVKANQRIVIPVKVAKQAGGDVPKYTGSVGKNSVTVDEYIVASGDTLFGIAKKFGVTPDALRKLNGLRSNSILKVGQKLKIKATLNAADAEKVVKSSSRGDVMLPTDPRNYKEKKFDASVIWPVKAVNASYVSGKVNSVLLIADKNEKAVAIKGGIVIFSGLYRGFGQVVFVYAQDTGHIYVYSGLESVEVEKGRTVTFGDPLGTIGTDAITGKPTLNFMVFSKGNPVDPAAAPRG